jgi:hypothetical protein
LRAPREYLWSYYDARQLIIWFGAAPLTSQVFLQRNAGRAASQPSGRLCLE